VTARLETSLKIFRGFSQKQIPCDAWDDNGKRNQDQARPLPQRGSPTSKIPSKGTRGKPPHSKMGWVGMPGASAQDRIVGGNKPEAAAKTKSKAPS
jgi:hypothetical protein